MRACSYFLLCTVFSNRQIYDLTVPVFTVSLGVYFMYFSKPLDLRSSGCDENAVIKFGPSDSSDGPDLSSAEPIFFYIFLLPFHLFTQ